MVNLIPRLLRRRRGRRLAVRVACIAVAVGIGCRDAVTAPPSPPRLTPGSPHAVIDPGEASPDLVAIGLPTPDMWDGSATASGQFGRYVHPTVVKVTITGGVETYTPNFDGIGSAETFGPEGRTFISWTTGGTFMNWRLTAFPTYLQFNAGYATGASRAPLGTLQLDGFRTANGTVIWCGRRYNVACFSYGGDAGTLMLQRVSSNLALTAEKTDVNKGETPYFDYRSSPQFEGGLEIPWVVAASAWIPDSITATDTVVSGDGRAACQRQYDPACRRLMISSGTFQLTAWVNGQLATKSVHVHVKSPHVKLTASRDSVAQGDTVILTATAVDGTALAVTGYTFTAEGGTIASVAPMNRAASATKRAPNGRASAVAAAATPECTSSSTATSCYVVPPATGKWKVSATVDGQPSADEVRVAVGPAPLRVTVTAGNDMLAPTTYAQGKGSKCLVLDDIKERGVNVLVEQQRDGSWVPAPGKSVSLYVDADDGTGGHKHGDIKRKPLGKLQPSQIITDGSGQGSVTYTASEFSGTYRIIGKSPGADSGVASLTVGIKITPKLDPGAAHYNLIGGQRDKHPDAWHLQSTLKKAVEEMADEFHLLFQRNLEFNDASLELGGRFDIDGSWSGPHCDHRLGRGIDLRTRDLTPEQLDLVAAYWGDKFGWDVDAATKTRKPHYYLDEGDPIHWHLKMP